MIYVNIRGNIGNQLFQYAFARKIQELTNDRICLNIYNFNKYEPKYYKFDLDKYVLNDNVQIEKNKKLPFFVNQRFIITRVIRKVFPNLYFDIMSKFGIYVWLFPSYKDIKIKKHKNYYIDGYWQSSSYFNDIKDILLKEFTPKNKISNENSELINLEKNTNSICISIRRGDYVTNEKFKEKFYICNKKYFEKAIEEIKKGVKNPVWFIFSDDINWAKKHVKIDGEKYYESGFDPVQDKLRLMSNCKNFILSNSSFSWWAQYLSTNNNKVIIAPSRWSNDNLKRDIYEKNWNLIEISEDITNEE